VISRQVLTNRQQVKIMEVELVQSVRRLFPASAIVAGQVAAVDDSAGAGNVAGARPLPAMPGPDIGDFDSIPSFPGDFYDLVSRNGGFKFTFLLNLQE
jgi:hypothetical protein